jgi:hypothetical protein
MMVHSYIDYNQSNKRLSKSNLSKIFVMRCYFHTVGPEHIFAQLLLHLSHPLHSFLHIEFHHQIA